MTRRLLAVSTMALVFAVAPIGTGFADDEGWLSLFDGKTLDGWKVNGGKAQYKVEDGTIVGTTVEGSPNTFLCKGDFRDFVLEFEVQCDPELNSGVQVRSHVYDKDTPQESDPKRVRPAGTVYGPQCEIARHEASTAGNFWDEARRTRWLDDWAGKAQARGAFRDGQWNRYRIIVQGHRYRSWVNGVPCANFLDDRDEHGFIGLQVHAIPKNAGPYHVRWRDLRIKELKPGEQAADGDKTTIEKRPTKVWTRVGPLGETPQHVTDAYPLSDQSNTAGWVKFEPMSDEFEGNALDTGKWNYGVAGWKGRQPALFSEKNVTVSDGKLHLTMRKEAVPEEYRRLGYHDYTSAALHTKARSSYGYYEVKARPMDSGGSSSFWFVKDETPGWQTEIDVFEIGGKAKGFEKKVNMTLHVFRTPTERKHWQVGDAWVAPWRLADDYHVYGLDWEPDEITFYVDGVAVRRVENTHWHQPLNLIFDSETMPEWFGMPDDADLSSTFSIEYVRAWKKGEGTERKQE